MFELANRAQESHRLGNLAEAEALYRELLRQAPGDATVTHLLAMVLCEAGELVKVLVVLEQALERNPDSGELWNDLGAAHWQAGSAEQASECFEKAMRLNPDHPVLRTNYGRALLASGRDRDGLRVLEVLPLADRTLETELAMARSHLSLWNLVAAMDGFQQVLERDSDCAIARRGLATACWNLGDAEQAIVNARIAIQEEPNAAMQVQLCRMLHYAPDLDSSTIAKEHRCSAKRYFPGLSAAGKPRSAVARLRVGYLSGLFEPHRMLLNPLLRGHKGVEVVCFSDGPAPQGSPSHITWVSCSHLSNDQVVAAVREHGIHVLVECDGNFRGGVRLPAFAANAAPVQVALAIYPGTTGVSQIGYRITEDAIDPVGHDGSCNERLLRIPHAFCYEPEHDGAPVAGLPALRSGVITFGSLSLPAKVNERVVEIWAAILRVVPSSTLVLQHYLDRQQGEVNAAVKERILRLFANRGVAPTRIRLLGGRSHAEHMLVYDSIDVALDPFPYNGTLTTLNALYMGVPVITLEGKTNAGRVGTALLKGAGLGNLVARDTEQYCRLAVETANDLGALRQLRTELRPALSASALMDSSRYASNLEEAYATAWNGS